MNTIKQTLDTKGLSHVILECQAWLENKSEHIRAYSPDEKEQAAIKRTIVKLYEALREYDNL